VGFSPEALFPPYIDIYTYILTDGVCVCSSQAFLLSFYFNDEWSCEKKVKAPLSNAQIFLGEFSPRHINVYMCVCSYIISR